MKPKEIITVVIATGVLIVSIFFMIKIIAPTRDQTENTLESEKIPSIPSSFDEKTYEAVSELSDYGKPDLVGIGKKDLFAGY
ncbi:MAG: hypothetical protein PHT36_01150 [Patescibacteria group bacterium]|nr:hypothetical protein [Patescibacteria group bacterium]